MDWLDRFQQKFGNWYQTAFGLTDDTELTPKDVLYKIIDAMEEFRSEGLDGKVYVPNKYIVEISVIHVDERDYLLSLLDEEELTTALERYMAHKNYFTRGPLDFTIQEIADPMWGEDKLYVRARFEREPGAPPASSDPPAAKSSEERTRAVAPVDLDLEKIADMPTIEALPQDDEDLTVHRPLAAWAALVVASIDGRQSVVSISKSVFTIGRSRHGGNDLIISGDGQVSKRHIRIELEPDHGATLYDLASTNGTFVNGRLVPVNTALHHGDVIEVGQTQLQFQRESELQKPGAAPAPVSSILAPAPMETVMPQDSEKPVVPARSKQARLTRATGDDEHVLASETLIGRGMTCDIVLPEATVSTQQAKIIVEQSTGRYLVQDLSGRGTTIINGRPVRTGERMNLQSGDRVSLSGVVFLFTVSE